MLVEADPAGGDLAARLGLAFDPGLVTMAASARHANSEVDVAGHAQPLPCGGTAVLGPTNLDQAEASVATVASRLSGAVGALGNGVIDCGRWSRNSPSLDVIRSADFTIVVLYPDLTGVAHFQERQEALTAAARGRIGLVLVGDRPYGAANVARATGVANVTTIAVDRDGVDALHGAASTRAGRKSRLVRSARSILDTIEVAPAEAALA
ncbi:MAG TPA: hypothetical protein VHC63_12055 [Acidimicrobiales bacterium]|nr:hypothetical protein [Acidimicrobiales bacterium]